jgi:hypothetical protein
MEQLDKFYVGEFLENLPRKYQVSLKAHKNERYFTGILMRTYDISLTCVIPVVWVTR